MNSFSRICSRLTPSLVLFLSVDLLRALNAVVYLGKVEDVFGKAEAPQFQTRDLSLNGKTHPRLKVGMQVFRNATVIALPHPGYQRGIADEYIAGFDDWIGKELKAYMTAQREGRAYR